MNEIEKLIETVEESVGYRPFGWEKLMAHVRILAEIAEAAQDLRDADSKGKALRYYLSSVYVALDELKEK